MGQPGRRGGREALETMTAELAEHAEKKLLTHETRRVLTPGAGTGRMADFD